MGDRSLAEEWPDVYLEAAARAGFPDNTGCLLRDALHPSDRQDRDAAWRVAESAVDEPRTHAFPRIRHA
jgi:hypothetical protein